MTSYSVHGGGSAKHTAPTDIPAADHVQRMLQQTLACRCLNTRFTASGAPGGSAGGTPGGTCCARHLSSARLLRLTCGHGQRAPGEGGVTDGRESGVAEAGHGLQVSNCRWSTQIR